MRVRQAAKSPGSSTEEGFAITSQEKLVESYMKWTVDARGLNIMSAKQRASLFTAARGVKFGIISGG